MVTDFDNLCGFTPPPDTCNSHAAAVKAADDRYAKGRYKWKGLTLVIEYPKGSTRSGTSKAGKAWSTVMKDHYGYFAGKESGADGDGVDFFMSEDSPDSELVFVVNQIDKSGQFDEHKCVLGCVTEAEARKTYLRNYQAGWDGLGSIRPMTLLDFKAWLDTKPEKVAADSVTGEKTPLPYRERAEMYAMKDGKLFGGLFDHGGFGVYGGGIDPGEDAPAAAGREFQEETGWSVSNSRPLPFDPHTLDWKPPFSNPKLAERAKQFKGSRTHYFMGDLGDQIPDAKIDELGRKDVRLYDLEEALKLADQQGLDPDLQAANKKRVEILKYLQALAATQSEKQAAETAEEFWTRNEASKERAKDAKMLHIRDGYIPCPGCHYRYHEMPQNNKCPKCGAVMRTRLRSIKRAAAKNVFEDYVPHLLLVKRAADDKADRPFTIAVDFDGTLAEQEEPFDPESAGPPRERAVHWVRLFHERGARIIIFTVRGDTGVVERWLAEHDVPYDHINENPDQPPDSSGKVFADVYIDDRAVDGRDPDTYGPEVLRRMRGTDEESAKLMIVRREVLIVGPESLLSGLEEGNDEDRETIDRF